jgi:hypothetical protein
MGLRFSFRKQLGCMDLIDFKLERKENKLHIGLQHVNLREQLILPCLLPQVMVYA